MAYDNTSFYGDMITDEYDDQNNFINPPTPTGFYVYHILGDSFDKMSDMCSQFLNDFSILSADTRGLDNFWGVSYNLERPTLPSGRLMNDDEYRIYLYLRNCRLITMQDIEVNFSKCFKLDDYDVYFTEESDFLATVDHLNYESEITTSSNLKKQDDDDEGHMITNFDEDEDTKLIESLLSDSAELFTVINVPYKEWDSEFLAYLEQFISIKGNLKIREYNL